MNPDKQAIHIAICDDEDFVLNKVRELCEQVMKEYSCIFDIHTFGNGTQVLDYKKDIDIVFLDIDMPDLDGFYVARHMITKNKNVLIIFLTSHEELIQKAFKVKAYRFLYKSCDEAEIMNTLREAIHDLVREYKIVVESEGKILWLDLSDIYYVEALGDGTALHLKAEVLINSNTLKYWLELKEDFFFRCHKSYLVNMYAIKHIKNDKVMLKNDSTVPISVRNKTKIKEVYSNFIKKNARYL